VSNLPRKCGSQTYSYSVMQCESSSTRQCYRNCGGIGFHGNVIDTLLINVDW
jgi:hypothetical protein